MKFIIQFVVISMPLRLPFKEAYRSEFWVMVQMVGDLETFTSSQECWLLAILPSVGTTGF